MHLSLFDQHCNDDDDMGVHGPPTNQNWTQMIVGHLRNFCFNLFRQMGHLLKTIPERYYVPQPQPHSIFLLI